MRYVKILLLAAVLGVALVKLTRSHADDDGKSTPAGSDSGHQSGDSRDVSPTGTSSGSDDSPTWQNSPVASSAIPISDDVKKLIITANQTRSDFLKKQEETHTGPAEADKEARDQVRIKLQAQHEAFIVQQREIRDELRKQLTDLKDQLKDHRDAIDQAKDDAKNRVHTRKDG